jgi:hypothetical protein
MEYSNPTVKINVINMPLFDDTYVAKNIVKDGIVGDVPQLSKMIEIIEFLLIDIIDLMIKDALGNIDDVDYYVVGGKAINAISSSKKFSKSFDYDIHCKNGAGTDVFTGEHTPGVNIGKLGKKIIDYVNAKLRESYTVSIRYQIFKKLLNARLVNVTERHYYMDTRNDLFYFGNRMSLGGVNINGVFLKLKMRNDLIHKNGVNIVFTNYRTPTTTINDGTDLIHTENIFYIPIADIDTDALNFGISVYGSRDYNKMLYFGNDNIRYGDYLFLLFNLMKYIQANRNKELKNINKLRQFVKPMNLSCNYTLNNNLEEIKDKMCNIINDIGRIKLEYSSNTKKNINKYTILIRNAVSNLKENLFSDFDVKRIITKITENYQNYYTNSNAICKPLLNHRDVDITMHKNICVGDVLRKYEELEIITSRHDVDRFILMYTDSLYRGLNVFCVYESNGIDTSIVNPTNISHYTDTIRLSNGLGLPCVIPRATYDHTNYNVAIASIDRTYTLFHTDMIARDYDIVADEFYVYSCQNVYNYISHSNDKLYNGISNLSSGNVIVFQQYVSTTASPMTMIDSFIEPYSTILKIKINKRNKNWLFIGKYSMFPTELEILIKKDSKLIVTGITNNTVGLMGTKIEYNVIELELLNDDLSPVDLQLKCFKTSGMYDLYDNPFSSLLFSYTLKYVKDMHLLKKYNDAEEFNAIIRSRSIICRGKLFNVDIKNEIYVDGELKTVHRPNHGLAHTVRVAAWIYIYLLNCLKNNLFRSVHGQINPKTILQICVASLFMITGRESEAGAVGDENNISSCGGFTDAEKLKFNSCHPRYMRKSAENFRTYTALPIIIATELFTAGEIDLYADCIENYYYISSNPRPYDSDFKKFVGYLFHRGHENDLVRCKDECEYKPVTNTATDDEITRELMVGLCKITGDRLLVRTFINKFDDTNKVRTEDDKSAMYDDELFYKSSTDDKYVVSVVKNYISEFRKYLIDEIVENNSLFQNSLFVNSCIGSSTSPATPAPAPAPAATVTRDATVGHIGGADDDIAQYLAEKDVYCDVDELVSFHENSENNNRIFLPYNDKYNEIAKQFESESSIIRNVMICEKISEHESYLDNYYDFYAKIIASGFNLDKYESREIKTKSTYKLADKKSIKYYLSERGLLKTKYAIVVEKEISKMAPTNGIITKQIDGIITKPVDGIITKPVDGIITKQIDGIITKPVDGIITKQIDSANINLGMPSLAGGGRNREKFIKYMRKINNINNK